MQTNLLSKKRNPNTPPFMFATGIENSYPVITGRDGKQKRIDQMEMTGHYERWREDFRLVQELGIEFLRYGPPYYKTHLGPGKYDWSFTDETFSKLKKLGITPIADLCHFGVPDWLGNFQNPEFPKLFAEYADAFSKRYSWVRFYTPVNEIFVAARFSGRTGYWNEQLKSDRGFVTALKHLAQATILAQEAILRNNDMAVFIQSESTEYFHPERPEALEQADLHNEIRFLSLDLTYGRDVRACTYEFLLDNGMTRDEYHWFLKHGLAMKEHCVMGNDYYQTNEHLISPDGKVRPSGEIFGYYVITKQYYDRYHLPVMHTETNLIDDPDRADDWLWKEWANMLRLKQDGVPIIGFTWYSLVDQIDWDTALIGDRNQVNRLGLFDLDRKIRPVGLAYQKLVSQWRNILPIESACLMPMQSNSNSLRT